MPLIKFIGVIDGEACSITKCIAGKTNIEDCLKDFCQKYCLNEQELVNSYTIMCNGRTLDPVIDKKNIIGNDDELVIVLPFMGG